MHIQFYVVQLSTAQYFNVELIFMDDVSGEPRVCRPPMMSSKQYAELCNVSGECDISRGLCCQVQRRHRQQPRKVAIILFSLSDQSSYNRNTIIWLTCDFWVSGVLVLQRSSGVHRTGGYWSNQEHRHATYGWREAHHLLHASAALKPPSCIGNVRNQCRHSHCISTIRYRHYAYLFTISIQPLTSFTPTTVILHF